MNRNERRGVGRIVYRNRKAIKLVSPVEIPSSIRSRVGITLSRENAEGPKLQLLPLKHLRLEELERAGFNCPDSRFWLRGELQTKELRRFFEAHGKISLRNFTEENVLQETPKLKVLYEQGDWEAIRSFCELHNAEYHTLVNESIPIGDSLLTGNIILLDEERYALSCFEGKGTPRDVDEKISVLKVCQRMFSEAPPEWVSLQPLYELIVRLREFRPDFRPMTVEFSIYPYPVGMRRRPEILWEWRGGSAYDFWTVMCRLLKNGGAHDLTVSLPGAAAVRQ